MALFSHTRSLKNMALFSHTRYLQKYYIFEAIVYARSHGLATLALFDMDRLMLTVSNSVSSTPLSPIISVAWSSALTGSFDCFDIS